MIKYYENWKVKRTISKVCDEIGYKAIFGKLTEREKCLKKVLKYFNVNNMDELHKKVEEGYYMYMYYNKESNIVVICIVEDDISLGFNDWMLMEGFTLNI